MRSIYISGLIFFMSLVGSNLCGQTTSPITFKNGTFTPEPKAKYILKSDRNKAVNTFQLHWLQLNKDLSINDLIDDYLCIGSIMDKLDDRTFAFSAEMSCIQNLLKDDRIVSLFDIPEEYKISSGVSSLSDQTKINARICLYGNITEDDFLKEYGKLKIRSLSNAGDKTYISIETDHQQIRQIARNNRTQSIETSVEEFTPLTFHKRSLEAVQGANVSEALGGLGLTGRGITIGHGDMGSFDHEDVNDRVREFAGKTGGFHASHTSGTIISAGNILEKHKGIAYDANIVNSESFDIVEFAPAFYKDFNIHVTNNSYAALEKAIDCNSMGEYNLYSQQSDESTFIMKDLLHVWASGNSGVLVCGGNYPAYNSVLSGPQCNKNGITVGSVWRREGTPVTEYSCQGPTDDGRIKPEIVSQGTNVTSGGADNNYFTTAGTSMSAPSITATTALMHQAYKKNNGDKYPIASLVKAILINTADDLLGEGPEYSVGYGKVNTMKACAQTISNNYKVETIKEGEVQEFPFIVTGNPAKAVITICWTDPAGNPLIEKQLINDLDLELEGPDGIILPWVLDPSPANAQNPAIRAKDTLNNMEQVSLIDPAAGDYTIRIKGSKQISSQEYALTYRTEEKKLLMNGPFGGEKYIPGEFVYFQWECPYNNGNPTEISLSLDDGNTWEVLGTKADSLRTHYYIIPDVRTGKAKIMVSKPGFESDTSGRFTICPSPANFKSESLCQGNVLLSWSPVSEAIKYKIFKKSNGYMTEINETADTTFSISNLNPSGRELFSVAAVLQDSSIGRRALSVFTPTSGLQCPWEKDLYISRITSPSSGRKLTSTALTDHEIVGVMVVNKGTEAQQGFSLTYNAGGNDISEPYPGILNPGDSALFNFTITSDFSASGDYVIRASVNIADDPHNQDNVTFKKIKSLPNDPLNITSDISTTYYQDFENATEGSYINGTIGMDGLPFADLNSNDPLGRARTYVISDIARSGSKGLSLDSKYEGGLVRNELIMTFNLANYNTDQDVKLGLSYLNHNKDTISRPENKIYLRGNDGDSWIQIYDLKANEAGIGSYKDINGIGLSKFLRSNGQNFSTSTQIRIDQQGNGPVISKKSFGGYTFDDLYLISVEQDISLNKIISPEEFSCGLNNSDQITIEIENNTAFDQSNVSAWYQLNSGPIEGPFSIETLAGHEIKNYSFNDVNLSEAGNYDLKVWITNPGDTYSENDTISNYEFFNNLNITAYPYLQTFENGADAWSVSGIESSWIPGKPSKSNLEESANGNVSLQTSLSARYNAYESSYLHSPCFDLNGQENMWLSFSYWFELETKNDKAYVEYTEDGRNWKRLGRMGQGVNWYNEMTNWDSTYTRWHVAGIEIPLDSMAKKDAVQFRFVLKADENLQYGGLAIDDVHVYSKKDIYNGAPVEVAGQPSLNWTDFESDGKIIASIRNNNEEESGQLKVNVYFNPDVPLRSDELQYYLDRNFSIVAENDVIPADYAVRLYFTDSEAERIINAGNDFHKPEHAYRLGLTGIKSDSTDGEFGNEINPDSRFYDYLTTQLTPYGSGYYLEANIDRSGEFYISSGGPEYKLPLGGETVTTRPVVEGPNISIAPNPFVEYIVITTNDFIADKEVSIMISDIYGEMIYSAKTTGIAFQNGLQIKPKVQPGVYLLRVKQEQKTGIMKIIKM